jgi:hypothetical protein
VDGHAQRAEAVDALELFQLDVLDAGLEIAERLQIVQITPVLRYSYASDDCE